MKTQASWMVILAVATILISCLGCSKKEGQAREDAIDLNSHSQMISKTAQNQQTPEVNAHRTGEDILVRSVIELWDAGKADEATSKFLSINWLDIVVFKEIRGLGISEIKLISLPENERKRIVQETLDLLSSMRKLVMHVTSEAERIAGSGNTARAKAYLNSVRQYGDSLSDPGRLKIVQKHGQAAIAIADEKLSKLQ
jgi:hypothetical protein